MGQRNVFFQNKVEKGTSFFLLQPDFFLTGLYFVNRDGMN